MFFDFRHVDENAAGDDRRIFVHAPIWSIPHAQIVTGADFVPDLAVQVRSDWSASM